MDKGAWWATVHGVAKSKTRLSDRTQHTSLVDSGSQPLLHSPPGYSNLSAAFLLLRTLHPQADFVQPCVHPEILSLRKLEADPANFTDVEVP